MNSYDVYSGLGTSVDFINMEQLALLIDKAPKTKEKIILAGIDLNNPIEDEYFEEKYESTHDVIVECLNEIGNTESFGAFVDDDGVQYIMFSYKAPWEYTTRERHLDKDDIVRILRYAEKVIEGFEIEDLCIANWISD